MNEEQEWDDPSPDTVRVIYRSPEVDATVEFIWEAVEE